MGKYAGAVVVWDRIGEYHPRSGAASDPIKGSTWWPSTTTESGLGSFLRWCASARQWKGAGRKHVITGPDWEFPAFCRWAADAGPILIVVEEADAYCSPHKIPREMAELVRRGRHGRIDQIYVSRRPAELHRDLTANADQIVFFGVTESTDLDWIRKRHGEEFACSVQRLGPHRSVAHAT